MFDRATESRAQRQAMVERQLARRGISSEAVLGAMAEVPREAFLSDELIEFAYADSALRIGEGQTISQPYIVALMCEVLNLAPSSRVLEVGTGSGYAAAVMSRIAGEVYSVERHGRLAESAREQLASLGYENVSVRHGDGSGGWPEKGPFDAIAVTAGSPDVPRALLEQLAIGGRLVIPVGSDAREQQLVRITRRGEDDFEETKLGEVRFVPLIGAHGWEENGSSGGVRQPLPKLIAACAEPIADIESVDLQPLLSRIGDARIVLLGEATHGTAEFYRMRTRITRELILRKGFRMVAVEADWPDAAQVDRYIAGQPTAERPWTAFERFPQWMWRNREAQELFEWLRAYNLERRGGERRVSFAGLDLYSLHASIGEVLDYFDRVDQPTAAVARERYGCLTPWATDPEVYGRVTLTGQYRSCEKDVVSILEQLLARRLEYLEADGGRYFDAVQNARLSKNAEAYYRTLYYGGVSSWNLRDQHMFETLQQLLEHGGDDSKIVVWAHNSHVGDADATEMSARGEHNIGSLCRRAYGDQVHIIGFGTHTGTVAAASTWNAPVEIRPVRPSHERSYERQCHEAGVPAFLLALRQPVSETLRAALSEPRLERAIGVIYRPQTELHSHYFESVLPEQFDEYIWFDETQAVTPLAQERPAGFPETYPFGL